MASNKRVGISVTQPKSKTERTQAAVHCCDSLKMSLPLLVDDVDDVVGKAYSGFPDRLYLIDRDGRVAYKGGRGPFGYKPRELEQTLILLLIDEALRAKAPAEKSEANESDDK